MLPENWTENTRRKFVRCLRICAIGLATALLTAYLDLSANLFDGIERQSYADRLRIDILRRPAPSQHAEQSIRVVAIDGRSYSIASGKDSANALLPRSSYATLIRRLDSFGAKVIILDILFDSQNTDDEDLAEAIHSSRKVVLACGDNGPPANTIIHPIPLFEKAGSYLGHTRVTVTDDYAGIDRIKAVVDDGGSPLPALSIQAVRVAEHIEDKPIVRSQDGWGVPGLPIVTDNAGAFKIHYVGSGSSDFPTVLFQDLDGYLSPTMAAFYSAYFKDKIVLVGDVTHDHGDMKLSPLGLMPGVYINANAISTVLCNGYFRDATAATEVCIMLLLALASTLLVNIWRFFQGVCLVGILLIFFCAVNVYLFTMYGYYLHLAAPCAASVITGVFAILERGLTEESEKKKMRSLLQRYVNPRIADYLILHPELIGAEGRRVSGTVLFSDISGFTALSERLTPEELVLRMNEYFQVALEIVFRHDGTAASIAGDAMLAIFGVPIPVHDHAARATLAALDIRDAVSALGEKWKRLDSTEFGVGIGINTGEMVVGEVGGKHLRNFSVYGLQVNIASRIQGLTKQKPGTILVSRSTRNEIATSFELADPQLESIKGVADPLEIYEVLGKRSLFENAYLETPQGVA